MGGLVQDCSNSIATPLELLQSCTKPSISEISENCGIYTRNLSNLLHGICQNHHYVDNHDIKFSYFDRLTCKKGITPLLMDWSYISPGQSYWFVFHPIYVTCDIL